MANQPLVAGAPTGAGPMGPPRLQTLLLSTTAFTAGGSPGDVLAAITAQTAGSTIGIAPSDASGLFAVAGGGTQLVKGLNWPSSGSSTPTVALRETLAGVANSPKDTAIGATISAGPALGTLSLANSSFNTRGQAGDPLSVINGQTTGSTISISAADTSGVFAIASGNILVKGLNWPTSGSSTPSVLITETLGGSSKNNTIASAISPAAATYLPSTTNAPKAVWAASLLVSAYTGPLYRIVRSSDSATMDVYPAAGSTIPDYSAVDAFTSNTEPTVDTVYDQTQNWSTTGANGYSSVAYPLLQSTAANRPILSKQTGSLSATGVRPITMGYVTPAITTYFVMPNEGISCRASSIAWTARNRVANNTAVVFEVYNASSPTQNIFTNVDWTGVRAGPATGIFTRTSVETCVWTGGASATLFQTKGTVFNGAVFSPTNGPQNTTGYVGHSNTPGFISIWDLFGFAIWNATQSSIDAANLETALNTAYGAPPTSTFVNQIVYGGSSLLVGANATKANTPLFMMQLGDTWEQYNMGAGGKRLQDGYINRAVEIGLYSAGRSRIIHTVDAPHNDFQQNTYSSQTDAQTANAQSAQNIYNNYLIPLVAAIKTAGARPVVPTMIAGSDITTANFKEYGRIYYNNLVRAGASTYGYIVADRAQYVAPGGGTPLDTTPTSTWYSTETDGTTMVHLNDAGYSQLMMPCDKAAVLTAAI